MCKASGGSGEVAAATGSHVLTRPIADICHAALLPADHSYALTEHFATTSDGYVLRLFRLLWAGKRAQSEPQAVVVLQHALLDSAAGWLIMGADNSLACLLAREGTPACAENRSLCALVPT